MNEQLILLLAEYKRQSALGINTEDMDFSNYRNSSSPTNYVKN